MRQHLESAYTADLQLRGDPQSRDRHACSSRVGGGRRSRIAQLRAGHVSDGVPAEGSIELWRFYVDKPGRGRARARAHGGREGTRAPARRRHAVAGRLGAQRARAGVLRKHGFRKVGNQIFVVGSDPQTDDILLCELAHERAHRTHRPVGARPRIGQPPSTRSISGRGSARCTRIRARDSNPVFSSSGRARAWRS